MRMCQCLPPKLVTNRLLLLGIQDELIHTDEIFKAVEEALTNFVGVPIPAGIPLSCFTQKGKDLFRKTTEMCDVLGFLRTSCSYVTDSYQGLIIYHLNNSHNISSPNDIYLYILYIFTLLYLMVSFHIIALALAFAFRALCEIQCHT